MGVNGPVSACRLLRRNVKRFRGGLVFKAHRLLYHSTLGLRVIEKKKWLRGLNKFNRVSIQPEYDLATKIILLLRVSSHCVVIFVSKSYSS